MAFDSYLDERIQTIFKKMNVEVVAKNMFGGMCYLCNGKMTIGIVKNNLMVRIMDPYYEMMLQEIFVLPMNFTGKIMKNFIYVEPQGFDTEDALVKWIEFGINHAKNQLKKF